MHRALAIPEVVYVIISADVPNSHALLRSCLLVNHLFSHEAMRLLWAKCGTRFPADDRATSPVAPMVWDLVNIGDTERAQEYASFIHEIRLVRLDDSQWSRNQLLTDRLLGLKFSILITNLTIDARTGEDDAAGADDTMKAVDPNTEDPAERVWDFWARPDSFFWHILQSGENLTSLSLEFADGSTISGPQLLKMAHACPKLTHLDIPNGSTIMMGPCPLGEDINDATMEEFARALPDLDSLCFGIENRSRLTYQSLVSLMKHCPKLGYLYLTADVSVPDLVQGLKDVPSRSFTYLRLYLDAEIEHEYDKIDELALELVRHFGGYNEEFSIEDGSSSDDALVQRVEELLEQRDKVRIEDPAGGPESEDEEAEDDVIGDDESENGTEE